MSKKGLSDTGLLEFIPLWSSLPHWLGLTWVNQQDTVEIMCDIIMCGNNVRLGHKGHYNFCLALSWSHTLGEASYHIVRTLKQPHAQLHVAKNRSLQPTAIEWVILAADLLVLVKPSDNCSLSEHLDSNLGGRPWARTTQLFQGDHVVRNQKK